MKNQFSFAAHISRECDFGRRIVKSSPSFTGVFAYDGYNLIETLTSTGSVLARYTMTQNIDEPLAMLRSASSSYYQEDGLGSVTSLTSSTASVANTYTYGSALASNWCQQ